MGNDDAPFIQLINRGDPSMLTHTHVCTHTQLMFNPNTNGAKVRTVWEDMENFPYSSGQVLHLL